MKRAIALCAWTLLLVGCASGGRTTEEAVVLGPLPEYESVAASYNARAAAMPTLWARTNVQVVYADEDGDRERVQGEGFLQVRRPRDLALQVGKLGETLFYLGSGDRLVWWFDLVDKDNKQAIIGQHETADPGVVREFGVPVHPLDLIELLPLTPMPPTGGQVSWRQDGQALRVRLPARSGVKVLEIHPERFELLGAAIASDDGELLLAAVSEGRRRVRLDKDRPGPWIPARLVIDLPAAAVQVRIGLYDAEVRPIADIPFDGLELLGRYRIPDERVVVVSEPEGTAP